ncbi:putative ATP-dependent RNA helicase DDX49 [Hypsibius exemplaris]|uniref:RNA helicase n=1 Tax=Hypsibius exemplaris TaxID=2072580 RepID=A0A1W0X4W7_HYPEX|nr:putative ATP-dependent RNA helicase DDX49 [Hypsibius exemplaris]
MAGFADLGLHEWLVTQCDTIGLRAPTDVQKLCIPATLQGRDCIGCAKTGSGKTAAFALPILQKLSEDPYGIFALVLTPTRELAHQIFEQFQALGKPIGLRVSIVIGGMSLLDQGAELTQRPHIIIATPGRLADHLRSSSNLSLKRVKFLVMDEADRLLVNNFSVDLGQILAALPVKRQTLLFSATMTDTLKDVQGMAMSDPFIFDMNSDVATVDELDQRFILTPAAVKDAYLVNIVQQFFEDNPRSLIMVFVQTCKQCQILVMALRSLGFSCAGLHSSMQQKDRLSALSRFKSHNVRVLISTDVGSRGLDIPKVDLVINHNVPSVSKDYIHRVGRTARARKTGLAITLVTQFDVRLIHAIEEMIGTKLKEYPFDESQIQASLNEVELATREAGITLDEEDFDERRQINKRKDAMLRQWQKEDESEEELTVESPKSKKKAKKAATLLPAKRRKNQKLPDED